MTKFKLLLWCLVIAVCAAIFCFSAQPSEQSSDVSRGVVEHVLEKSVPGYNELPQTQKTDLIKKYHKITRKFAHFFLYTLFGILTSALVLLYNIKGYSFFAITLGSGFLYACSDEVHQRFVPGRSAQFSDVALDTSGVAAGLLLVLLFVYLYRTCKKLKNN